MACGIERDLFRLYAYIYTETMVLMSMLFAYLPHRPFSMARRVLAWSGLMQHNTLLDGYLHQKSQNVCFSLFFFSEIPSSFTYYFDQQVKSFFKIYLRIDFQGHFHFLHPLFLHLKFPTGDYQPLFQKRNFSSLYQQTTS